MEVLNGYLKSPKAVATTKKGNVPFGEADLASIFILLAAVPVTWQNQYSLKHFTVPESPRTLLLGGTFLFLFRFVGGHTGPDSCSSRIAVESGRNIPDVPPFLT